MQDFILRAWHHKNVFFYLVLIPISYLFSAIVALRHWAYKVGLLPSIRLPVPVIIVGNINMGGSGKTPVVIWLVQQLIKQGYTPGVISRGYGGNQLQSTAVNQASLAHQVGDEPLLIARRANCPVWIGKNRVAAGQALLEAHPACDVIISDDGLQYYHLQRTIEIAVVDDESIGHQYILPAGPLREPQQRLNQVDAVINHSQQPIQHAYQMQLCGQTFYNLADTTKTVTADFFSNKQLKAIAGIGKPARFFNTLSDLGLTVEGLSFDDHHQFSQQDLAAIHCEALLMTEKDAVKCQSFAQSHYWVLPIEAKIDKTLLPMLLAKLKTASH